MILTPWSYQTFEHADVLSSVDLLENFQLILTPPVTLSQVGHSDGDVGFFRLPLSFETTL